MADMSPYSFGYNNPIYYNDPMGLFPWPSFFRSLFSSLFGGDEGGSGQNKQATTKNKKPKGGSSSSSGSEENSSSEETTDLDLYPKHSMPRGWDSNPYNGLSDGDPSDLGLSLMYDLGTLYEHFSYENPDVVGGSPDMLGGGPGSVSKVGKTVNTASKLLKGERTIRGVIKAAGLPVSGKIRFVPPKTWKPTQPLKKGPNNGYLDRFGNEWTKKKVPGKAFGEIHWDVNLSSTGKKQLGRFSNSGGKHINVTPTGQIDH